MHSNYSMDASQGIPRQKDGKDSKAEGGHLGLLRVHGVGPHVRILDRVFISSCCASAGRLRSVVSIISININVASAAAEIAACSEQSDAA